MFIVVCLSRFLMLLKFNVLTGVRRHFFQTLLLVCRSHRNIVAPLWKFLFLAGFVPVSGGRYLGVVERICLFLQTAGIDRRSDCAGTLVGLIDWGSAFPKIIERNLSS